MFLLHLWGFLESTFRYLFYIYGVFLPLERVVIPVDVVVYISHRRRAFFCGFKTVPHFQAFGQPAEGRGSA